MMKVFLAMVLVSLGFLSHAPKPTSAATSAKMYVPIEKDLYDSPCAPGATGAKIGMQMVNLKQSWYLVQTYAGPAWISLSSETELKNIRMVGDRITPSENKKLYSSPCGSYIGGDVKNQPLVVLQAWHMIDTWLGPKWISFNYSVRQDALILSTMIYNVIDGYVGGSNFSLNNMYLHDGMENGKPKFNYFLEKHYDDMEKYGFIYPDSINRNVTITKMLANPYHSGDWMLKTYLDANDATGLFFGAVFHNQKTNMYMVAIRGTNNWWEHVLTNSLVGTVGPDNIFEYKLAKTLLEKIPDLPNIKNNVIITGHSLGGYLANALAVEYGITAYTFNAPGIDSGSKFYASAKNKTSHATNFVIKGDTVGENTFPGLGDNKYIGKTFKFSPLMNDDPHGIVNFYKYIGTLQNYD